MNVKRYVITKQEFTDVDSPVDKRMHYYDNELGLVWDYGMCRLQDLESALGEFNCSRKWGKGKFVLYLEDSDLCIIDVDIGGNKTLPAHLIPPLIHETACFRYNTVNVQKNDEFLSMAVCDREIVKIYGFLLFAFKKDEDTLFSYFTYDEMRKFVDKLTNNH